MARERKPETAILVWEDPPARGRRQPGDAVAPIATMAAALRRRPGCWARLRVQMGSVDDIKHRYGLEVVTRFGRVYARARG